MRGVGVVIFLGLLVEWGSTTQYLNNRPYPTYSLEKMPDTEFSCREKILGGYYADPDTQCQMFHVCVKVAGVGVQDFRFLCPNGTAFDQDHQICAEWDDVDCDATTLYYSSDNFDLYRIGSGFESKAVKYGEEEEPFSLQRAETGDARINRDHQTHRVNQQKDYNTARPSSKHQPKTSDRDIFKGSSSSNFFNNRNSGKETEDEDDYESKNVNYNQNEDRFQKRKFRKQQQAKIENEDATPRPFARNNFAGSSYLPSSSTVKPSSTTIYYNNNEQQNHRGRPRHRANNDKQYNNADSFRQTNSRRQDDNQSTQFSVSTPAPFKTTQQSFNNNNNNNQYSSTTPITPFKQQQKSTYNPATEGENYPSFAPALQSNPPRQNYPIPQKSVKETESYPTTASFTQNNYNTNYEVSKTKYPETFPTTKKPTAFKQQTNPYPTTFSPKTFKTTDTFPTTFAPRTNAAYTQITQSTQYNQNTQNYNQNTQNYNQNTQNQKQTTPFVTQNTQYNTQQNTQRQTNPSSNYNQFDNTRSTNTQQQNRQTVTYNPSTQTQKQTTQYTQYTPTVPRITTPYHTQSTTPSSKRSSRFDETQYDDGSYDSRYDNYDNSRSTNQRNNDDEFLKTAHSTNIASSRNEFVQSTKTTQKPRPFAVTPNSRKNTDFARTNNPISLSTIKPSYSTTKSSSSPSKKSNLNASYDYAYYDTNAGSEAEYDIDTEIEKSNKKH